MELKQIIAKNITELRKQQKLTQAEFAQKLNYTDKAISKWERGESIPSVDILKQIADMFGVTVDYLLQEGSFEEKQSMVLPKNKNGNKLTISLLGVSIVWFIATIIYVYSIIYLQANFWQAFIWAVPFSCIVLSLFNYKWGKKVFSLYINSVFTWSFLASVYLQFLHYQLWLIFIIGIPAQICIILWSNLKPDTTKKFSQHRYIQEDTEEN